MKRLLAGLTALILVAGCGTPNPSNGATTGDIELAAANVAHVAGSADDAASAGSAINAFGVALYRRLVADDPSANLVMSPASIALALSMARAGARGQTATEMDALLRDLGTDEHAAWVAALDSLLNARTGSFPDGSGQSQDVTLRIVNAPFAQRGFALEPAYLDALGGRFGAGLRLVDYVRATEAARKAINAWVAEQTGQRIPELLAQGDVDDLTRLVLVNAIYLKAAWQTPFGDGATAPAPFTRLDGTTVDVPMMHAGGELPYASGTGWQAVELPYVGGKLSMLVIVPDDLAAFEQTLDDKGLAAIVAGLAIRNVSDLGLPKFGAESKIQLKPVLAALGMPTAFTDSADFSGMTKEEPLQIAAVIHQANIDVDEKGTEAAAATAVVARAASLPSDTVTLTVDRPFLFALRDVESSAVLFLGRITDPSARSEPVTP
jgi:serine protease inhibitor